MLIDDDATLKRVYIDNSTVTLVAENSTYPPLVFNGEQLNNIKILGKAVAFQGSIK